MTNTNRRLHSIIALALTTLSAFASGCAQTPQPVQERPGVASTIVEAQASGQQEMLRVELSPAPSQPLLLGIYESDSRPFPVARFRLVRPDVTSVTDHTLSDKVWVRLYTADGNPMSQWIQAGPLLPQGDEGVATTRAFAPDSKGSPPGVAMPGCGVPVQVEVCMCAGGSIDITYDRAPGSDEQQIVVIEYYQRNGGSRGLKWTDRHPVSPDSVTKKQSVPRNVNHTYNEIDVYIECKESPNVPRTIPKTCGGGCTN